MNLKSLLLSLFAVSVLFLAPQTRAADTSITLTNVHMCCKKCVIGASNAVSKVEGASAVSDIKDRTVVLTGPDTATVQKAVDALTKAGFYGGCSDASIKIDGETGAKGEMVKTLKVKGVHLCCGSCVKVVNKVLADVPGVTTNTAAVKSEMFEVTGDFKDSDVLEALKKAGLLGKVAE